MSLMPLASSLGPYSERATSSFQSPQFVLKRFEKRPFGGARISDSRHIGLAVAIEISGKNCGQWRSFSSNYLWAGESSSRSIERCSRLKCNY